jgi:acyl transferase domain-containing protein/NADPH:quinone reductase-like Zn-dependent oxidoreductase/acyl carrier protein
MSGDPTSHPSAARLALLARRARQDGVASLLREPIAVIGMGCRLPGGADSPERFWSLLLEGFDAVSEAPADRWDNAEWYDRDPATPGRSAVKHAGFLEDAAGFDAAFFGISAREAERMDPHQRLALEVAWEALEDAGLRAGDVWERQVGVFTASYNNDYVLHQYLRPDAINERTITGVVHSIVANRISYYLGLHGPSITIDTACSSSLVALHLAVQSLRAGGCDAALAGGVSLMLRPEPFVAMSKAGFMSPDGRCKTFDARADGFGRGEGCGFVVLKRLSDALAAGDRIDAVIRGTAVNQDGRSTVLAAPNGRAQVDVVRAALADGQVDPALVSYIEAHGTGTRLGDPIEVEALAEALGAPARGPRLITSVKANIGHLDAAAGIAGVIKAVLALRHRRIAPQVQFVEENPLLELARHGFEVPLTTREWAPVQETCVVGVSSFGVGGTNAHVVLEAPPFAAAVPEPAPVATLLLISARTTRARDALAERYAALLDNSDASDVRTLAAAAAQYRTRFEERLAVVGGDGAGLSARLRAGAGALPGVVQTGRVDPEASPRVVFVCNGQGSQWAGMATQLMQEQPGFRSLLEEVDAAFQPLAGWSLLDALAGKPVPFVLDDTACAQPLIFAVQVALGRLLQDWGVQPFATLGHSVGELAAACLAGHIALADAITMVYHRGRVMQQASPDGAMLAARLTRSDADGALRELGGGDVVLAGINAPRSVVFSGPAMRVQQLSAQLAARGVQVRDVGVRYAFHGIAMRPLESELAAALPRSTAMAPTALLISTVTGEVLPRGGFDGPYVARNMVSPVRFHDAVRTAIRQGATVFLELGPRGVLGTNLLEALEEEGHRAVVTTALTQKEAGRTGLLHALGALYCAGVEADWSLVLGRALPDPRLPRYAWQHERYWLEGEERSGRQITAAVSIAGERIDSPAIEGALFERVLDPAREQLGDHRIGGQCMVPGAMMLEMARAAGESVVGARVSVRDASFLRPVSLSDGPRRAQLWLRSDEGGHTAELYTSVPGAPWSLAFRAVLEPAAQSQPGALESRGEVASLDVAAFYVAAAARGCDFGPGVRRIRTLERGAGSAFARLDADGVATDTLAPALLDAALQPAIALLSDTDALYVPASVERYERLTTGVPTATRLRERAVNQAGVRCFDVDLYDDAGSHVACVHGLSLRAAPAGYDALHDPASACYGLHWVERPAPPMDPASVSWVLCGGENAELTDAFAAVGVPLRPPHEPDATSDVARNFVILAPQDAMDADAGRLAERLLPVLRSLRPERGDRVLLLARGAHSVDGEPAGNDASAAAFAGVSRALRRELAGVDCAFVDIDTFALGADTLRSMLAAPSTGEPVLALRGDRWLAPRLERIAAAPAAGNTVRILELGTPGDLDSVRETEVPALAPRGDEVEIEVRWGALNFRDVLAGMELVTARTSRALGHECAGIVRSVGPEVHDLAPGDEVVALAEGAFAERVICRRARVFRRPALGWPESVTVPIAFLTAHHALVTLARLQPGQRVLIHSGAGGVGLAAIQLAQRIGAEVFASAGSVEKRTLLQDLGVARVYDSRSIAFREEILADTSGAGVDVVLNSLAGGTIDAGLAVVRRGGCFVELGKRDVRTAQDVERALGVRYIAFDLFDELDRDATPHAAALAELSAAFENGSLTPLPWVRFPHTRAADAFRLMARAGHTGKILLSFPTRVRRASIRAEATYLITGGTGEVGLATAAWLVARGARSLVLTSRRPPSGRAAERVADWRAAGVDVRWHEVSLGDADSVRALIAACGETGLPLRGVVHAAGALDDGLLTDLDAQRFAVPFTPKVAGALNLAAHLVSGSLDFLLLYSAAGSLLDPAGQGNYAAANAVIDALAAGLRSAGHPATSVAWGLWQGGMAAQLDAAHVQRWHAQGLRPIGAEVAAALLDQVLASDCDVVVPLLIEWPRYFAGRADADPLLSGLRGATAATPAAGSSAGRLRALPAHRQQNGLREFLLECVARVLGRSDLAEAGPDRPLRDLGMDSLMAVELRNLLTRELGHSFSATLAFDYPDVPALVVHIAPILFGAAAAPTAPEAETGLPGSDTDAAITTEIMAMTDAEAERELLEELRELGALAGEQQA